MVGQDLHTIAVVLQSEQDNVAVAKRFIPAGTQVSWSGTTWPVLVDVQPGHRFALYDISAGEPLLQYGQPFGISRGIMQGGAISGVLVENRLPICMKSVCHLSLAENSHTEHHGLPSTFQGYRRADGIVGTRNYILVLPTSLCASETARQLATEFDTDRQIRADYPGVDGFVATPHGEGCAVRGGDSEQIALRTLCGYIMHPNAAAVVVLDQGCENLPVDLVRDYLHNTWGEPTKPIRWLSIQDLGGVGNTMAAGREAIMQALPTVSTARRSSCSVADLVLGTECGGSDAFSGITANPVLGHVADLIVAMGGRAILSEIPEIIGAEQLLIGRAANTLVANDIQRLVDWYVETAHRIGVEMNENPSLGNQAGGLLNIFIKSLGAVAKGGTSPVVDVVEYAEKVKTPGLSLMQGPGNDLESVTGLVAAGANVVGFTTGRGSVTGNPLTPVVKIATNSIMYEHMSGDMDFNAGVMLETDFSVAAVGASLYKLMIAVASGDVRTCSEQYKQCQFQIWRAGAIAV